jgi:hypothetical protein
MKNLVDITMVSLVSSTIIIGFVILVRKFGNFLNKGNSKLSAILMVIATTLAIVSISLFYRP